MNTSLLVVQRTYAGWKKQEWAIVIGTNLVLLLWLALIGYFGHANPLLWRIG